MPLLFVLAGVSARLALKKRTYSGFVKERLSKLLLPLISGMVTVVALMTYYADRFNCGYKGSFLSHYKVFFTKLTTFTGYDGGWTPAHLWFLLYLFLVSMLCLGVIVLQKKFLPKLSFKNMNAGIISALGILPLIFCPVLNFAGKSVASYIALYLIGYYVISENSIMDKIVKHRLVFLIIMLITDVTSVYMFIWAENSSEVLSTVVMYIASWFGILALLGFGRKGFDMNNKVTRYLTSRSFLFYVFHFIWIVIFQFYLSRLTDNIAVLFIIPIAGTFIMTFVTCEIIVRIPFVNFLFGVKKKAMCSDK
jgi:membrane-bound acyltransferase YfiQ involved in biofilm formation